MTTTQTKCYDYTLLYAASNVIKHRPKNIRAAGCVFRLLLSNCAYSTESEGMSKTKILKIDFGLFGALTGVLAAGVVVIIIHQKSKFKREQNALHEEYISGV